MLGIDSLAAYMSKVVMPVAGIHADGTQLRIPHTGSTFPHSGQAVEPGQWRTEYSGSCPHDQQRETLEVDY